MRQQRTSAVRRVRSNELGAQYTDVDWLASKTGANQITLTPVNPQSIVPLVTTGWVSQGVLALIKIDDNSLPSTGAWDGTAWVLDYATPIGPRGWGVRLNLQDPGRRTDKGGWLMSKMWLDDAAGPGADAQPLGIVGPGVDVVIDVDDHGDILGCVDTNSILRTATGERPSRVYITPTQIHTTWPTPLFSGDQVIIFGGQTNWITNRNASLVETTLSVP
jgi:hypothetical protein